MFYLALPVMHTPADTRIRTHRVAHAQTECLSATNLAKLFLRKRRAPEEGLHSLLTMNKEMPKRRSTEELSFEAEADQAAGLSAILLSKKQRQERGLDELRINNWWCQGYQNWDDAAFKKQMRVSRDTLRFILAEIENEITKQPNPTKPNPRLPATRLAICLYRLALSCTFVTMGDLFGIVAPTAHCIFLDVWKAILKRFYDRFVFLSRTSEEQSQELQGFLENWDLSWSMGWLPRVCFHQYEEFLQLQEEVLGDKCELHWI